MYILQNNNNKSNDIMLLAFLKCARRIHAKMFFL